MHYALVIVSMIAVSSLQAQQSSTPQISSCSEAAQMRIYSSAFVHEETGDLLGYELAIKQNTDSTVNALLYVYEGAPDEEGIPLSGRISGKSIVVKGNWEEHLVESPSKKEIIQSHFVKVDGVLDAASFQGHVKIENMDSPDKVRLKRVKRLWFCKQ
jgi:hypothetical protein